MPADLAMRALLATTQVRHAGNLAGGSAAVANTVKGFLGPGANRLNLAGMFTTPTRSCKVQVEGSRAVPEGALTALRGCTDFPPALTVPTASVCRALPSRLPLLDLVAAPPGPSCNQVHLQRVT